MTPIVQNLMFITAGAAVGIILMALFFKGKKFTDIEKKQEEADKLISNSKEEASEMLEETKKRISLYKENLEETARRREERIKKTEELLDFKEESTKRKHARLKEIHSRAKAQLDDIRQMQKENKETSAEILEKIAKKASVEKEDLKEQIIQDYKNNVPEYRIDEENLKEEAMSIAKKTIVSCLQRMTSPTSAETRAVNVKVAKDFIKGKIVGKDAQNIAYLESLLDVAIVFNDLPQTISVSAFNLVERRIAQRTIEKLIKVRGEIDKKAIDDCLQAARTEVDEELYGIGKKAVEKMRFEGWDKDMVRTVGRLQYRTSYGQNIMRHSMEVGWMAMMLAAEIGLDLDTAKVAGFLHDVGKAIDQDPNVEDAHDRLTKEIMEKHGFSWECTHAAWVHHDAEPQQTAEALLIKAADAVSAGRPGARAESLHSYAERIEAIEKCACAAPGVKKVFAISAGREVRMMVDPEKIDDAGLAKIAREVADNIEENVVFPGHIKVNAIRRSEYIDVANNPTANV